LTVLPVLLRRAHLRAHVYRLIKREQEASPEPDPASLVSV